MKTLFILALGFLAVSCAGRFESAPRISSRAAIVWDVWEKRAVYEKNADLRMPVASTQKLLTAMESLDAGGFGERVAISPEDARQPPTTLGLAAGSRHRKIDLVGAMLVSSANDAASALSHANGDTDAFLEGMNRRAKALGADNSRFKNPHGLDEVGQYSTARDMALIGAEAMKNRTIRRFAATRLMLLECSDGGSRLVRNTNQLLWSKPEWFDGLKSGFTLQAGKCLVATGGVDGREVVIVLLGGEERTIFNEAEQLFRWRLDSLLAKDQYTPARRSQNAPPR